MKNLELMKLAKEARCHSHSPYSKFSIGACVLMTDGSVYTGCNIENASYGATICAERVAIVKAISEGHGHIKKIAISGPQDGIFPCGICRQFIAEFADESLEILIPFGNEIRAYTLEDILPHSFGREDLNE